MSVHIIPNELRIVDDRGQELDATHVRCGGTVRAVRAASGPLFECANCGVVRKRELETTPKPKTPPQVGFIRDRVGEPWHKLRFGTPPGTTHCGRVIANGDRKLLPAAGALICDACMAAA